MRWESFGANRALAGMMERGAAAAMMLLGVTFALESIHPILGVGGMVLTSVEIVLLTAAALWVAALAAAGRSPRVPHGLGIPTAVWLGALLTSALLAPSHRGEALKFSGRMTAGVLVAWAAYDLARTAARREGLARALATGGVLVAILGLGEALRLPGVEEFLALFKHERTVVGEVLRVSSTLGYATTASMVLELSVPLIVAWLLTAKRRTVRVLLAAGLAAALACQALTLTRGGLIALTAALGLMTVWAARYSRRLVVGSAATSALLLALWVVVFLFNPVAKYRLVSETERAWYQAAYEAPRRLTIRAGETVSVPVTVTNTGIRTWQVSGDHPFRLSYHLTRRDGAPVRFEGPRAAFPEDVAPGAAVRVLVPVTALETTGYYVVQWDVVQEDVTWFGWEGQPPASTLLTVIGRAAGAADGVDLPSAAEEEQVSRSSTGSRERGRLWLWRLAGAMFMERPLFGVGPDGFRWQHGPHAGLADADERVHANNLYVEWLVDTGLVGFAAFLWMTWRLARAAWPSFDGDRGESEKLVWQAAVGASLTAWFVHGGVDFFYAFTPTYVAFALLCGLALAGSPGSGAKGRLCASDST